MTNTVTEQEVIAVMHDDTPLSEHEAGVLALMRKGNIAFVVAPDLAEAMLPSFKGAVEWFKQLTPEQRPYGRVFIMMYDDRIVPDAVAMGDDLWKTAQTHFKQDGNYGEEAERPGTEVGEDHGR